MKKYRMSDIMSFDNELFMLANYEAAEGLIPVFETQEQIAQYRIKVAKIFNKYKRSIQDGECDLDFVMDTIMSKYGAIPQPRLTPEEIVENVISGKDMNMIEQESITNTLLDIFKMAKRIKEELPPKDSLPPDDDINDDFNEDIA